MNRITPSNKPGLIARILFYIFRRKLGVVPKSKILTAGHSPTLIAGTWMDSINAAARTIPASLKELAQIRVAALVGCVF